MRHSVLLLAALTGLASAGLTEMRLTDAAAEPAGMAQYVETGRIAPEFPCDEIRVMPGWPKQVSSSGNFGPSRGVALADFDGDGRLEVIMPSTANQLHVWKHDGSYYPGWPRSLPGMGQYAAAVADIDLDGQFEVAVCTRGMTSGGAVCIFAEDGAAKPGWPFTGVAGGNFSDSPTLVDLDGDDTLEIIAGERGSSTGYLHVLRHNGTELPGWPYTLDHVPAMGAAVGDIDLDGVPEIVYGSYNSLYVFRTDGTLLAGWPQTNPNGGYFSYQSPCLVDVDGDDTLEIVVAEHRDGSGTYVWRYDGTLLAGWPFRFPRWTYCPPTACDLFRDGSLKVLCGQSGIMGGAAAVFYGFDGDGSVLSGFPIVQPNGDAAEGNIAVADLDGDGDMEIIFTSNLMSEDKGYLFAVHHDGNAVDGWPLRPGGFTYQNGATVGDVDGDDSLDIVVVAASGAMMEVTVYEAGVPFNRAAWESPTYQFDMARTGLYRRYESGLVESELPQTLGFELQATIVRGVLRLPQATSHKLQATSLLDITGRRVWSIPHSAIRGPQSVDVSRLAPGVYFLRSAESGQRSAGAGPQLVRRVIVAR